MFVFPGHMWVGSYMAWDISGEFELFGVDRALKCWIPPFFQETEETEIEKPGKRKVRARRMPFDPKAEPGAMEPLGYFDPLGICPPGILALKFP